MAGKEPLVYIDGEYYPKGSAKISVYDHGLLYGDGVFEGIRAYNGIVFHLREHIERLLEGLRITRINVSLTKEDLMNAVIETLRRNNFMDAYIRLIITRGRGNLGLDPRSSPKSSVIIMTEPVGPAHGKEAREKGITAIISSYRRDMVDGTTHELKSLNYIQSVLAKFQAIDAGTDEVVMLDHRGMVSEFHGSNLFLVKSGAVHSPTSASGILHGITRSRVLKLAEELGYDAHERDITPYELLNADEVFLTGTMAEVVPVVRIQGVPIGDGRPGPVTKEIIKGFQRITQDPKEGTVIREQVTIPARARSQ
ncbi:MAG TPA: branched-chain-amino-acid transaminase [Candidatus Dormibacteraeota bacterium]|jgi:branched-chain amino acid aminotransferase|nr:branched-chain-amino-acid transaminase [Candidatus Dormibacteraeota bacterium]